MRAFRRYLHGFTLLGTCSGSISRVRLLPARAVSQCLSVAITRCGTLTDVGECQEIQAAMCVA